MLSAICYLYSIVGIDDICSLARLRGIMSINKLSKMPMPSICYLGIVTNCYLLSV